MTHHKKQDFSKLPDLIRALKPHDHLCLIYESREEWLETIIPYILIGLERGEKCIYVVDANTAQEIKAIFIEAGLAVDEHERKGQFSVIHERDAYTREGSFDPDLMIAFLISETEKALREGYSALRVTGEMSWALRGYRGAERVLEYEAKLNKDLFPAYPCVAICQYDRWKFDPEIIKGVVLTHPLLIRGGQIYRNFYYIEPDEYLNHKKGEREVQHWLNNLERERKTLESLQESEERHRRLFETMAQGVIYQAADGTIISANPAAERILGISFEQMQSKTSMDPRWQMIEEDGMPVPGSDHPAMIALRTGKKVGPVTRGAFHPDKNAHVWLNITAIPLFQPGDTEPFQAYATFDDITERKQAEESLRRREEDFRALAENAPDLVVRFDRNLRHLYVNPVIVKETGIPREEFIGRTNEELNMPAERTELWNSTLLEAFKSGREKEMYFDYKTPAGQKYYHSRIVPEFTPDGSIETVLSITRDITAIKEMEAALYQERAKTRRLHQRALPDALPLLPGLALAAYYRPTSDMQGDYYNLILRHNQLLLYLVDIEAGRDDGVMQSLYVRKTIEDYLQAHAGDAPVAPALLLHYLTDRYQQEDQPGTSPLCVFIAVFDLPFAAAESSNQIILRYTSSGFFAPPLAISGSGEPDKLSMDNLYQIPAGLPGDFEEQSFTIVPGSTFVFSTDGLFNQGPDHGSYESRLREVLRGHAHLPPELINQAVDTYFAQFCNDSPLYNDLAFIVVQVPEQEHHLSFKVESDIHHAEDAKERVASFLASHYERKIDLLNFHELLVNAMEHGNKRDGGKRVSVDVAVTGRYYKIRIIDQGEGFNWRDKINRELDLSGESDRGRGIIMTRMMTDYLGYNERGNRATMINLID